MIWFALLLDTQDPNVQAVAKVLADAEPKLHRCWEKAAADDNHVDGHIDLNVCIGKDGKPKKIIVQADSTGHPTLTSCATAIFQGATFAGFQDGDEIDVPIDFQAEDQYTIRAEDVTAKETDSQSLRLLLGARNVGAKATMSLLTLKPNQPAPPPYKLDDDVTFVVLDGAVSGHKKGDSFAYPAGTKFSLTGSGSLVELRGAAAARPLHLAAPEADHAAANARELYVTSGSGALVLGGETFPIEAGMGVYVPPNTPHHLIGTLDAWEFEARP
jgi:mannose-6-phosphate isomerase-like protein (cupin superfamily)